MNPILKIKDLSKRFGAIVASDSINFNLKSNEIIAGALNFIGQNTLYGRNWGAKLEIPFLHFELCYYQPIEYAIRHRLKLFEAGAQGEHKIQRGFLPQITYSAHWLEDKMFYNSVSRFLEEEKQSIQRGINEFRPHSPYLVK